MSIKIPDWIPGLPPGASLDLNPFDGDGKDEKDSSDEKRTKAENRKRRERILAAGRRWDGKGTPPSREAAIGWLMAQRDLSTHEREARGVVESAGSNSLAAIGNRVRQWAGNRRKAEETRRQRREAGRQAGAVDADGDDVITPEEIAAATESGDLEALIGAGPGGAIDDRGNPLLPMPVSPEQAAGLEIPYQAGKPTTYADYWNALTGEGPVGAGKTKAGPPRYYEENLADPLKWSTEQRADWQRVVQSIGLYGDRKIKLGSWGAADTDVWEQLLTAANVEGRTWTDMLAEWNRNPPQELLDEVNATNPKPTIRLTNPIDIRRGAEDVSRSLIGEVDRSFVQSTVGGYQSAEAGAQQAAIADQEGGGGGSVTDAPSVQAYVDDRLRREQPIEVDGYQFLNQFQTFMQMVGA